MLISLWPGIQNLSRDDFAELQRIAPNNWNLDDLLGHISSESGWNPSAKSPDSTAAGLAQMTDATARRFAGVGASKLACMSTREQLPSLVKYFSVGLPMAGADFKLLGFSKFCRRSQRLLAKIQVLTRRQPHIQVVRFAFKIAITFCTLRLTFQRIDLAFQLGHDVMKTNQVLFGRKKFAL